MNKVKLNNLIKKGGITIPSFILEQYHKFNLTLDEFVLLMYLYNYNCDSYDPTNLSNELNLSLEKVMEVIESLSEKGFISIDVIKANNGLMEEKINLNNFYEKIELLLMEELNEEEEKDDNLFNLIEEEFNRKLKPIEQELIIGWQKEYSDELIKEALKEATLTGSLNLRFIDKLLFDWQKQGVKNTDDIKKIKEVSNIEVEEYNNTNWFEEDNEV